MNRLRVAAPALLLALLPASATEQAVPTVLSVRPHDPEAFTQGLVFRDGVLYESTGLYGRSTLRRVDPATGEVLLSIDLPDDEFGEGLARVGGELVQLTWLEGVAHRYAIHDFSATGDHAYAGEGWGLCHDGARLVMSDGSGTLFFRDPQTFELLGEVEVLLDDRPVTRLNELECVGDLVYANVWLTDTILRIDAASGVVLTVIDAAGLLTPAEEWEANVLNGIAFDPATARFWLTGKLWPKLFEVAFPFNPYGAAECTLNALREVENLRMAPDGANGVSFAWDLVPLAPEYHVNSIDSVEALTPPGPHRPDVPGGEGVARCDALHGETSCTDTDALTDPEPLLFYQVFAACGPQGADEGP